MAFLTSLATASAVLLSLTPNATPLSATVQSSLDQSRPSKPTEVVPAQLPTPVAPTLAQQTPEPECLPSQFLSPFSDVYPTDWAYAAVVQLAAAPSQCFELPSNLEGSRPQR